MCNQSMYIYQSLDNSDSYVVTFNMWLHSKYLGTYQSNVLTILDLLRNISHLQVNIASMYLFVTVADHQLRGSVLSAPESCHLQTGDWDQCQWPPPRRSPPEPPVPVSRVRYCEQSLGTLILCIGTPPQEYNLQRLCRCEVSVM